MPNNSGNNETAQLLKDIGTAVHMDYECGGSSATPEENASSFKEDFEYSSATYNDSYNYNTVESEIRTNHPVILRGGRNAGWWIFGKYADGHQWVCDGLMTVTTYECRKVYTPMSPIPFLSKQPTSRYLFFHMNWGWSGSNDGYYAFDNFNPGSYTFNYERGMIVNIRP